MPHQRGPPISYEKRVAVITLRLLSGDTFVVIARKLHLSLSSVNDIFTRAIRRTEPHLRNSFEDVVRNIRDAPRTGRPATNPQRINGSSGAVIIRNEEDSAQNS